MRSQGAAAANAEQMQEQKHVEDGTMLRTTPGAWEELCRSHQSTKSPIDSQQLNKRRQKTVQEDQRILTVEYDERVQHNKETNKHITRNEPSSRVVLVGSKRQCLRPLHRLHPNQPTPTTMMDPFPLRNKQASKESE